MGVEGDVGAAGLEDREEGDEHLGGARGAEADEDLGADAERAEAAGEPVGPGVELAVGEGPAVGRDRDGVRSVRDACRSIRRWTRPGAARPAAALSFRSFATNARFSSSVLSTRRSVR